MITWFLMQRINSTLNGNNSGTMLTAVLDG